MTSRNNRIKVVRIYIDFLHFFVRAFRVIDIMPSYLRSRILPSKLGARTSDLGKAGNAVFPELARHSLRGYLVNISDIRSGKHALRHYLRYNPRCVRITLASISTNTFLSWLWKFPNSLS